MFSVSSIRLKKGQIARFCWQGGSCSGGDREGGGLLYIYKCPEEREEGVS